MNLSDSSLDYLNQRASLYNGNASDILAITPASLATECSVLDFWEQRHLSHVLPQSDYPELADDWSNIIPENPASNLARGDEIMSPHEYSLAIHDNETLAASIRHDPHLLHGLCDWF